LYNMAHGELDVLAGGGGGNEDAAAAAAAEEAGEVAPVQHQHQTKKERMSNLSFAQRRHEIAWRLAQHGKALQHVAALTAANASSDLSQAVAVSSRALQHARTAWVQADEAQDALYFFHAQLFPARAAPHDLYGALDIQLQKRWFDLPYDLRLMVDRYETSQEADWNRQEVDQRWQLAVRDKLVRGEVGWSKLQQQPQLPWKLTLKGGILQLTHGRPKQLAGHDDIYPVTALLTVLSPNTQEQHHWTLLSLEVRVQAKTGEFNHQLETSNRQRYDLHRLAALSMGREEAKWRQQEESEAPALPLSALYQVVQTFSLSWQLELLSAQAQALRRGVWAATGENSNPLQVTPVRCDNSDTNEMLGVLSISFWKVDDAYGPPSMGDLTDDDVQEEKGGREHYTTTSNKLILSIRALPLVGMRVSMSGASSVVDAMKDEPHLRDITRDLLEATSNPLALSVSDALLAATRLCAELKCKAVVQALQPPTGISILPSWIRLSVERGVIAVAARVNYHGIVPTNEAGGMPILFRLMCDARTGSFVATFPRPTQLLRQLACNYASSSHAMSLRMANIPPNRRRAASATGSGRFVRDAFDGLVRSMNSLGLRAGVGSTSWDNLDGLQSQKLRERAIQSACADVKISLEKCCGMAALFGLFPLALGCGVGLDPSSDM
jgi:hypothetical protein